MTKKDYKAIAQLIAEKTTEYNETGYVHMYSSDMLGGMRVIVDVLCTVFKKDNPRFDEQRFLKACMPVQMAKVDRITALQRKAGL